MSQISIKLNFVQSLKINSLEKVDKLNKINLAQKIYLHFYFKKQEKGFSQVIFKKL